MNMPSDGAHDRSLGADRSSMRSDLVIVGLGYVGLPLAQEAAASGLRVVGFDVSDRVVDGINSGRSHVDDLSDAEVAKMLADGFSATADPACIATADAVSGYTLSLALKSLKETARIPIAAPATA